MPRTGTHRPTTYRDQQRRVWYVSDVAKLRIVSASIDGPNVALVIRFEREGEARLARWLGGDDWQQRPALDRLFDETEAGTAAVVQPAAPPAPAAADYRRRPEAPIDMRLRWIQEVADMGADALELFEQEAFEQWDGGSLVAVRRAIDARRRELARQ